jgi:hypothetical protein
MRLNNIISVILCLGLNLVYGQEPVVFVDESWRLEHPVSSDFSLAVSDLNGDYRDDVVRATGDSLHFTLQYKKDELHYLSDFAVLAKPFNIWTTNIADLDNDGYNEVLISGNRSGISAFSYVPSLMSFEPLQHLASDHYAQGSSISDVTGNGMLDYLVSNDTGNNILFENDNKGFLFKSSLDDFNILSADDAEGNYNAIWLDPDNDGDMDLYVTKCHVNASSFSDPRRLNLFFERMSDNSYVERASEWGLDHGDQSWCSASGDLDNDGDTDILLLNHKTPIILLENVESNSFVSHVNFTDRGELTGDEQQVVLADYNNDGLLDIFIFGFNDRLLLNSGNLQFEVYQNPIGAANAFSGAVGDLNNDGWLDVYAVYGTADSGFNDRLWINFGGNRNFLKLSLHGTQSNTQGIDSKIIVYGEWGMQQRYAKSGESYGITNSQNIHFGLGEYDSIDSLVCIWPSGVIDKYYDLEVNSHYLLTEGECIEPLLELQANVPYLNCSEEMQLSTLEAEVLIWNDEIEATSLHPDTIGFYYAKNEGICKNSSDIIFVDSTHTITAPLLFNDEDVLICEDQSYVISSKGTVSNTWSNNMTGNSIMADMQGFYFAYDANVCDTLYSDTVQVKFIINDSSPRSMTINQPGDYFLVGDDDSTVWYDSEFSVLDTSKILQVSDIHGDSLFYFSNLNAVSTPSFFVGPEFDTTLLSFPEPDINPSLELRVERDIYIHTTELYAETAGLRKLEIHSNSGGLNFQKDYYLEEGKNTIFIGQLLQPGNYLVSFKEDYNREHLGNAGPALASSSFDFDEGFYSVPGLLEFYLPNNYGLFFNWKIEQVFEPCDSGFIPFSIELITSTDNVSKDNLRLEIFPNPVFSELRLNTELSGYNMYILDSFGQTVFQKTNCHQTEIVQLYMIPSGIYFIRLEKDELILNRVIIKQ